VVALCTLVWGATGGGRFWPGVVFFSLAGLVGCHAALELHRVRPGARARGLTRSGGVAVSVGLLCFGLWAVCGAGYPWWAWVWMGGVLGLGTQALVAYRDASLPGGLQDPEHRRIERDLHDGAQARLVALSLQLGRAEERLGHEPDAAALVRSAREEAGAVLAELRGVARAIAPHAPGRRRPRWPWTRR